MLPGAATTETYCDETEIHQKQLASMSSPQCRWWELSGASVRFRLQWIGFEERGMPQTDAIAARFVSPLIRRCVSRVWRRCRSIASAVRRGASAWEEREGRRAAIKGLDDWILKDIGLTRGQALQRLETPPETIDTIKPKS